MNRKKQSAAKSDLEFGETLCLFPIESKNDQVNEFDPERSLTDYMTWTIASYAIKNRFVPPFRLQFTDANNSSFGESVLHIEEENLVVETKFKPPDSLEFPVRCELTDVMGRTHRIVVSPEEITQMETAEKDGSPLAFPVMKPYIALEGYVSLGEVLEACEAEGIMPPYSVEIRDSRGVVYDECEIAGRVFRIKQIAKDWHHAQFPFTIKVTRQGGEVITTTVERNTKEARSPLVLPFSLKNKGLN